MSLLVYKPLRIFILAGIGGILCSWAQAQDSLAAPLTADPVTAPITTLAIDLLAPQRSFVYDPTGSSVFASALDPSAYASSFSVAAAETDTALRDSSQTGQANPFTPGASQVALAFAGSTAAALSRSGSGSAPNQTIPTNHAAGAESETSNDHDYRSSWGSGSSLALQPSASVWDAKTGQGMPSRLDLLHAGRPARTDTPQWNASAAAQRDPSNAQSRKLARTGKSVQTSAGAAETQPSTAAQVFALRFTQEYSLSTSPFSLPRGRSFFEDDLPFLNPSILGVALPVLSSSSRRSGHISRGSVLRELEPASELAAGTNHYRLVAHPYAAGSDDRRLKSRTSNPYLSDNGLRPDRP